MIQHPLPPARPGPIVRLTMAAALSLIVIVVLAPGARSQDRTTDDRLDRVERDLNMLQRQVYRGGPPPNTDPTAAVSTDIRMDRLEEQMRTLTGRVEEFSNQVEQLRQRIEQINSDIDVRFGEGQAAPASASPAAGIAASAPARGRQQAAVDSIGPGADTGPDAGELTPPASLLPPGAAVPAPAGPQAIFGTLTPPGATPSSPPPELARAPSAGSLRPPTAGDTPVEQYNHAFGLLKQADYPAAEEALKAFVLQHPDDAMAANAEYWLGETYYARGRYADAAVTFAEGYKRYPKGGKAPDDLLKLGMSLARANQKQNACIALLQLDHAFPNSAATIKERASSEKKRLGC